MSIGELASKIFSQVKKLIGNIQEKMLAAKTARTEKKEDEFPIRRAHRYPSVEPESATEPLINDFADVAYRDKEQQQTKDIAKEIENESEEDDDDVDVEPQLTALEMENHDYTLPSLDLLDEPAQNNQQYEKSQVQATVRKLEKTFHSFGVKAKITKVNVGPAVTKYEVYPDAGVKVSKIVSLMMILPWH